MDNLAGHPKSDERCREELRLARIPTIEVERCGGPRTIVAGKLGGVEFRRAWCYWIASGKVPLDVARRLYEDPIGQRDVRVDGFCGNEDPEKRTCWFDGDEHVAIDPDGSKDREYDAWIANGEARAIDKPRFARATDGLQGYVMGYHIDSLAGLRLFADTMREAGGIDTGRRPEMVLRAMLRAYQTETLDAHIQFGAAWIKDTSESSESLRDTAERRVYWEALQDCCDDIERELVFSVAYRRPVEFTRKRLQLDYDARLCGERPIGAPPSGQS